MMQEEIWKEIPEWEGYEVSNLGNIRSWNWCNVKTNGARTRSPYSKTLKSKPGSHNYRKVSLRYFGQVWTVNVCTLVALTFIGPRPEGLQVAHSNGNSLDDRLENLSYKTALDNNRDRYLHGTMPEGERNGWAKLNNEVIIEIYTSNLSGTAIAKKTKVPPGQVSKIRKDKAWKHITKNLTKGKYEIYIDPRKTSKLHGVKRGRQSRRGQKWVSRFTNKGKTTIKEFLSEIEAAIHYNLGVAKYNLNLPLNILKNEDIKDTYYGKIVEIEKINQSLEVSEKLKELAESLYL